MAVSASRRNTPKKAGLSARTRARRSKPKLALGLLFAALLAGAAVYGVPQIFKPTNEKAETHFLAGEIDQAIAMWTRLADKGDIEARKRLYGIYLSDAARRNPGLGEKYLQDAAKAGDAASETLLGKRYHEGVNGPPNPELAVQWLSRAALKNTPEAMGILSEYYRRGNVVPRDVEKALNLMVGAAEKGDPGAMGRLGQAYYEGDIIPRDYGEAEKWLTLSNNEAFPDRNRLLGIIHYKGLTGQRNIPKAIPLLLTIESSDDPETCLVLGLMYYYGDGTPTDDVKAERFLRFAAENRVEEAYTPLGTLFYEGVNGHPDYREAYRFLRLADESGDTSVCGKLGFLLYEGKGVEKNVRQALEYLTRYAVTNRNVEVNALLGKIYYHGDEASGIAKNPNQAAIYLQLAADDGDVPAQTLLAYLYYNGEGVQRDYAAALRLLNRGLETRLPEAVGLRGRMYYYGDGGKWDKEKGLAMLRQAAGNGDAWSRELLRETEDGGDEIAAPRPMPKSVANPVWENISFGMSRVEAMEALAKNHTVLDGEQLPGFQPRGTEVSRVETRPWTIYLIFNRSGLLALEFVPTNPSHDPFQFPPGIVWSGVDMPVALSTGGIVVSDIFAADSPLRQALVDHPDMTSYQATTLASQYFTDIMNHAGRELDVHWVKLPAGFRFVDPETADIPTDAGAFISSLGRQTLKISYIHGTRERPPSFYITTEIYMLQ